MNCDSCRVVVIQPKRRQEQASPGNVLSPSHRPPVSRVVSDLSVACVTNARPAARGSRSRRPRVAPLPAAGFYSIFLCSIRLPYGEVTVIDIIISGGFVDFPRAVGALSCGHAHGTATGNRSVQRRPRQRHAGSMLASSESGAI